MKNSQGSGSAAQSIIDAVAHGLGSTVKTQVLRRDRISSEEYAERLDICSSCPGGHATFRGNGQLYSCGPLLESIAQPRKKGQPCGCLLKAKARDLKEECPFGYWPTIEGEASLALAEQPCDPQPRVAPYDVMLASGKGGPGVVRLSSQRRKDRLAATLEAFGSSFDSDMTRRRFLGMSVASIAVGMLVPRAMGDDMEPYYIPLEGCSVGGKKYVACEDVEGRKLGEVGKLSVDPEEEPECYEIISMHAEPESKVKQEDIVQGISTWHEDCEACETSDSSGGDGGDSDSGGSGSSTSGDSGESDSSGTCSCGSCDLPVGGAVTVSYSSQGEKSSRTVNGTLSPVPGTCGQWSGIVDVLSRKGKPLETYCDGQTRVNASISCGSGEWVFSSDSNDPEISDPCSGFAASQFWDPADVSQNDCDGFTANISNSNGSTSLSFSF